MSENPMIPSRLTFLPLFSALVLALAACSKSPDPQSTDTPSAEANATQTEGADHLDGADDHGDEDATAPVKMDEDTLKAAGIRLQRLQPTSPDEQLRAPGEVVDNAYGTTLITPRVEALVVRRHAKLGDEVRAGAPLVTLASVDVSDAQADLRIAEQEWRWAARRLRAGASQKPRWRLIAHVPRRVPTGCQARPMAAPTESSP
jgi:membrane fusion protein, heavy metal efflux system